MSPRPLVLVPTLLLSGPAWAGSPQTITLDATAAYRGIDQRSNWDEVQRDDLTQTIELAYDAYLIQRSLASLHLGFALDHRTTFRDGQRSDLFSPRYDARVKLLEGKAVPIVVYADRQAYDALQADVPGSRVVTDTFGYNAAVAPPGMPRLQSRGMVRDYRRESDQGVERILTSDVSGALVHVDERLLVRGVVDRRVSSRTGGQRRALSDGELYADYQIDPRTDLVARAWTRAYDTVLGGESVRLETQYSDLLLRTRPLPKLSGTTYYRIRRSRMDDLRTDELSTGSTWAWAPTPSTNLGLGVGATRTGEVSVSGVGGDPKALHGEFVNARVELGRPTPRGEARLSLLGGLAGVQDPGLGSGLQWGLGAQGIAARAVGKALRVTLAGDLARQWDGSPAGQTWWGDGWRVGVDTGQLSRLDFQVSAGQANIDKVGDEDSRQFQVQGRAGLRLFGGLAGSYSLVVYRDVFAASYASGVRHAVRIAGRPVPSLGLSTVYAFDMNDGTGLAPAAAHRVDANVAYTIAHFDLNARLSWAHAGGRTPTTNSVTTWIAVSRSFQWSF